MIVVSIPQDKMRMARAAYIEAEKLVKRCLNSSHQSWNELSRASLRRPLGSPGGSRPSRARGRSLSDEPLGGAHSRFLASLLFSAQLPIQLLIMCPVSCQGIALTL